MLKTGDVVVVRKEAPCNERTDWWNNLMDDFKDGVNFYVVRVDEDAEGFVHLKDTYNHGLMVGGHQYSIEDFTWHSSWLQGVNVASEAEVAKKPGLYYSDRHEIIPQQPGESDKAYLRRILGGR